MTYIPNNHDNPNALEQQILALVEVYKVVTADQIAEFLNITWDEAYVALLRLSITFSRVTIHPKQITEFHIVERRNP